jgi:hypothetical protein
MLGGVLAPFAWEFLPAAAPELIAVPAESLGGDLAMQEAMNNPLAQRIMQGLIKDSRFPETVFGKYQWVHRSLSGAEDIAVHFWRNLETGAEFGFKVK